MELEIIAMLHETMEQDSVLVPDKYDSLWRHMN